MLRWTDAENPRNRNRKAEKNLRREFSRFAKFRQFASPQANFGWRATEQMGGFVAEVRIFFKKRAAAKSPVSPRYALDGSLPVR
ncbi:hypothetical protein GYB59_09120 [bacterium]|nr:hypothetical protein [bacterium]